MAIRLAELSGSSRAGLWGGGSFIVFLCENFLDTIACYRKHCRLGLARGESRKYCLLDPPLAILEVNEIRRIPVIFFHVLQLTNVLPSCVVR